MFLLSFPWSSASHPSGPHSASCPSARTPGIPYFSPFSCHTPHPPWDSKLLKVNIHVSTKMCLLCSQDMSRLYLKCLVQKHIVGASLMFVACVKERKQDLALDVRLIHKHRLLLSSMLLPCTSHWRKVVKLAQIGGFRKKNGSPTRHWRKAMPKRMQSWILKRKHVGL
jgi:hypothetical protein